MSSEGARQLHLRALDPDAAHRLAQAAAGAQLATPLRGEIDAAGGNPLFILEIVSALRAEGSLSARGGTVESDGGPMPGRLRSTVLRHVHAMAGDTVALLQAGSIFGGAFSATDVMAVTGWAPADLVVPAEKAIEAGLLEESGGGLVFRHDLIRQSVYEDLPLAVRASMHERAAQALQDSGAPVTRTARHLVLGATGRDRSTVERLREAASAAVAADVSLAIESLEKASQLAEPFPDLAERIDDELLRLLPWADRGAEAVALAQDRLASTIDARRERRLRPALAEALAVIGRVREAADEAAKALALPDLTMTQQAHLHVLLSIGSYVSDPAAALAAAAEGERLACEAENLPIAAAALAMQAWASRFLGRPNDVVSLARQATASARLAVEQDTRGPAGAYLVWTLSVLGYGLCSVGDIDDALRACAESRATAARFGLPQPLDVFGYVVRCHVARGAWDDALAEIDARRTLLNELGLPDTGIVTSGPLRDAALRAPIAVMRGRIGEALPLLTRWAADAVGETDYPMALAWRASAEALTRPAQALRTFEQAWQAADDIAERAPSVLRGDLPPRSQVVGLAARGGRSDFAERVTLEAAEAADTADVGTLRASALTCRAVLDKSVDTARAAVGELRQLRTFPRSAWDMAEAARVIAVTSRGEASAIFAEAAALEKEFGVMTGATGPRRTGVMERKPSLWPKYGWESLTATELAVVDLVARGLSNPAVATELSISRHTVEAHLKHVYAKLGLHSRAALAAEATRRQTAG